MPSFSQSSPFHLYQKVQSDTLFILLINTLIDLNFTATADTYIMQFEIIYLRPLKPSTVEVISNRFYGKQQGGKNRDQSRLSKVPTCYHEIYARTTINRSHSTSHQQNKSAPLYITWYITTNQ